MVLKEDQAKVKALLTEAITVLCKNGLSYRNEFSVEGLLGVTLDNEEVFLISINETIREIGGQNMSPNPPSVQRRSPMPAPQRGQMGKGRGTPPANRARVNQGMQNARKRSLDGEFKNTHPQQGSTPGTPSHPSPHSSMGSPPGTPGTPQQLPGQTDPDQPPIKRLNDDGTQDGDDTLLEDGSANLAKIKSEPGSIPTGDGADWDSTQTDQHDPNNQAMQMPSFGDEFNLQGAMDPAMNVKMEQTGQIPQHSGGAGPGMNKLRRNLIRRYRNSEQSSPESHLGGLVPGVATTMGITQIVPSGGLTARSPTAFSTKSPIHQHGETPTKGFVGTPPAGRTGTPSAGRGRGRPPHTEDKIPTCRYRGCGVVFDSPLELTKHVAENHTCNAGESVCAQCGQVFSSATGLKFHMSKHTGSYRFRCEECDKGFNFVHHYNDHMAKHEGTGFPCKYCGKLLGSSGGLKIHLASHTGIYPFYCEMCQKGFSVRREYETHINKHQNKGFTCTKCGKMYFHPASLESHQQTCVKSQ